MKTRPLPCPRCGSPAGVAEDISAHADWGLAVIDDTGTVRPARQYMEFYKGDPIRIRAVCSNDQCSHQWTLRRPFIAEALGDR